ncbi:MAG TPA: gliding motility lipoprotein GldH [Daejeonella sp.]|nr:gliding motility lipoprotein GldH [Daejeonella sp.]
MFRKARFFLLAIGLSTALISCRDSNTLVDTNQEIMGRNWGYDNKIRVPVQIQDEQKSYNIYLNLRHSAEYKYSNIFVLLHIKGPDGKLITERKEFKLAEPNGEWVGKGSGNMYSYQLLFKKGYRFLEKGTYSIEIEQNMRDNPLREITDIGLRVENASE